MRILAVDFGDARTGLAICDRGETLASPVGVIAEHDLLRCAERVAEAASANGAEEIVVGHPLNMNGSSGERAEKCELFAKTLGELLPLPVTMWDERRSTVTAHNYLNDTNTRGKKRKAVVDAVAATVILEGYLSYRRNNAR